MSFIINPYQFGVSYHPLVTAWLARGTALGYTTPSLTVLAALSAFCYALDATSTTTSRMKTGYILHSGSLQMGSLNLKDPLTYQTTLVNSPSFSEGNGVRSNGSSSYINQPFTTSEYVGIENDLTAIQYVSESNTSAANQYTSGATTNNGGTQFMGLSPFNQGSGVALYTYIPTAILFNSGAQHKGLYIFRGKNNAVERVILWKDGTKFTTNSQTPTAPNIAVNRFILAFNNSTTSGGTNPIVFYPKYLAIDFLFDGFSDTDAANFKTAFDTYKTAVGLP